jgi:hypothetical protein
LFRVHGLFFVLLLVLVFRPSPVEARGVRAARGSSLQREPRVPPDGVVRVRAKEQGE